MKDVNKEEGYHIKLEVITEKIEEITPYEKSEVKRLIV